MNSGGAEVGAVPPMNGKATSTKPSGGGRVTRLAGLLLFLSITFAFVVVPGSEGSARALDAGIRLAQEHRLLSASAQLESAAARPGGDPEALSRLGDVLVRRQQPEEAVRVLRLALASGASDRQTMMNLATALEKAGDLPASLLTLRQELALRPTDAEAWTRLVRGAAQLGERPRQIVNRLAGMQTPRASLDRWQEVAYLEGACLMDPASGPGTDALSLAASGPDAAVAAAARDLLTASQEQDSEKRPLGMAQSLLGEGLNGPALEYLDEPRRGGGPEATRQALLGYVLMKGGKLDEAEAALRRSQQEAPDLQAGLLMMGVFLRARGDSEQAIPYLEKAAGQSPANPAAYVELSDALAEASDYVDAEKAMLAAVKARPEDGDLRLALANFYISYQVWVKKGVPEAREALRLLGKNPSTLSTLAWGLHLDGLSRDALPIMLEAVEMEPESALFRYRLGSMYEGLGDQREASKQYELVRELDGTGQVWKRAEGAINSR